MSPIYEVGNDSLRQLDATSFGSAGLTERRDLQRLLRDQIEVVADDVLVIAEEFGEWTESRRRIDLLGVDKDANLVIIELKRTDDGGHMELDTNAQRGGERHPVGIAHLGEIDIAKSRGSNKNWTAKIRQQLQLDDAFERISKGVYDYSRVAA